MHVSDMSKKKKAKPKGFRPLSNAKGLKAVGFESYTAGQLPIEDPSVGWVRLSENEVHHYLINNGIKR